MIFAIFSLWIAVFTLAFTFLPLLTVLDWKKRGTADGFSSVGFVQPILIQCLWLRHGFMRDDWTTIVINTVNTVAYSLYVLAFAYYQPKRKYLVFQLLATALIVKLAFLYVDSFEDPQQMTEVMGSIAASAQIFSLGGGIHEIKRTISMGTSEYVPANIQFAVFALSLHWLVFALALDNYSMAIATCAGLLVNVVTLSLYFFYPPLTWTVPIFNISPQKKNE